MGLPAALGRDLLARLPAGRLRRLVHPVGDDRRPPAVDGRAGRPHRADAAGADRPDVRLPQRPDRAPPGILAVVGLAVRPQAGLVLPGAFAGGTTAAHLRRGEPRHLVARRPGHRSSSPSWPSVAAASPWRSSPSGSPPSGSPGRGSIGPPSSTTTTRRCRSWSWPWPTSWRSCGTARRRRTWLVARIVAGLAIVGPAVMWVLSRPLCAFVGVESVNPGSAACPAVIPDFVADRADRRPGRRRGGRC